MDNRFQIPGQAPCSLQAETFTVLLSREALRKWQRSEAISAFPLPPSPRTCFPWDHLFGSSPQRLQTGLFGVSVPSTLIGLSLIRYCFWSLYLHQTRRVTGHWQYLQCQKLAFRRKGLKGFRGLLFSLLFWLLCHYYANQFVNVPYKMHEPVTLTNTQSSFVISS